MAGGGGERFWPRSRQAFPKQLLAIFGKNSMIQETVSRIAPLVPPRRLLVITNRVQAPHIAQQIKTVPRSSIIAEPFGRDTAACIALGTALIMARDPEAVMVVLPADHVIHDRRALLANLTDACRVAEEQNCLVTLGIVPSGPATGYGYIRRGRWLSYGLKTAFARVENFTEKPALAAAKRYMHSGKYLWNSGIFVWKAAAIAEQIGKQMPELYRGFLKIRESLSRRGWQRVVERVYQRLPRISIDYGVMEKADNVVVARADFDWDDAGSWLALERHLPADTHGNIVVGDGITHDSRGCIIMSEGGIVGCLGLDDVVVIRTPDAVLVCHRGAAQDIKKIVGRLKSQGRWAKYL